MRLSSSLYTSHHKPIADNERKMPTGTAPFLCVYPTARRGQRLQFEPEMEMNVQHGAEGGDIVQEMEKGMDGVDGKGDWEGAYARFWDNFSECVGDAEKHK